MSNEHKELQIVYKNNKAHGIRDSSGLLFLFVDIGKYPNQEERYRQEIDNQMKLADFLLMCLKFANDYEDKDNAS